MQIESLREEYNFGKLSEGQLPENPFKLLESWLNEILKSDAEIPNSMVLSTIGRDGFPDSRIVLLKALENEGLTFFTNYQSNKALDIEETPHVSLTFFWPTFQRQVRIKGKAEKTSEEISNLYFSSRPENSRIAAWASPQSQVVQSREDLTNNFSALTRKFAGKEISRPPHWGGYLVKPVSFEFWQGRENRLHDRFLYTKDKNSWNISRLAP